MGRKSILIQNLLLLSYTISIICIIACGSSDDGENSGGYRTGRSPNSIAVDSSGKYLYVANSASDNISGYSIEPSTGKLSEISGSPFSVDENPSWIRIDASGKYIYILYNNKNFISAFSIDPSNGVLTEISGSPFNFGSSPMNAKFDPSGEHFYVSEYTSGSSYNMSICSIDQNNGIITKIKDTILPYTNHILDFNLSHSGEYLYTTYLDQINAFSIDPGNLDLSEITGSPFDFIGNRALYLAVEPSGKYIYILDYSSTIYGYAITPVDGSLTLISGSPFNYHDSAYTGVNYFCNPIVIDPSGKFVFVANSDTDSVAVLSINSSNGTLSEITGSSFHAGDGPRSLAVDPTGKYLYVANNHGNSITAFQIDSATGTLSKI